jgi:probable DNA metabolism protein
MELFEDTEDFKNPMEPVPDISGIFELSVDAYCAALYAHMSCKPIKKEIAAFIEKVKRAGNRHEANRAATDRGDGDVLAVLTEAGKVTHEIHRLTGLLRFSPESDGVYTARCAPDNFILPALAEHFTLRFGEMPWAIIDEKRGLCLRKTGGEDAILVPWPPDLPLPASLSGAAVERTRTDSWEELWRLYHKSINNESKKNLRLQRQFMPERYQKYLTELNKKP